MQTYGGYLKLESFANLKSGLLAELNEEIAELRKSGDYSQEAMEQCRVGEIIKAHTGINVTFYVNKEVGYNAFAKIPSMDSNHPFFTQSGFEVWFGSETSVTGLDKGPLEGSIDSKKYKVTGAFGKVEAPIMVGLPLIKDKSFTNEEITEIIAHEVGHHYTYYQLLGGLIRDSWLIANASKVAAGAQDIEVRKKVLVRTQEQLGTDILKHDELLASASATRKDTVELVLVSNSLIKGGTQSGTPYYDARTVEQIADSFVAYHGGGRHLASALVKFSKMRNEFGFRGLASRDPVTYLVVELLKTMWVLFSFFTIPVSTIIWLIAMIPDVKRYDDPEMRVNTLKQQLLGALRQAKSKEDKDALMEEIQAVDMALKELKDKRNFYTMVYETITPVGRKRYNQEKQQEAIKSMLFNEFQAKALQMRT